MEALKKGGLGSRKKRESHEADALVVRKPLASEIVRIRKKKVYYNKERKIIYVLSSAKRSTQRGRIKKKSYLRGLLLLSILSFLLIFQG